MWAPATGPSQYMSKYLKYFNGSKDLTFLEEFKANWNRTCNYYIDHVVGSQNNGENFVVEKIKTLKDFGKLYEIYLKYKVLPDIKFVNSLDRPFWDTLEGMQKFLGDNPYPTIKAKLDPDASYNIRYKGVLLIEYLEILSRQRVRFYFIQIVKYSIYLLPLVAVIAAIKLII